jgi:hypothetical protein
VRRSHKPFAVMDHNHNGGHDHGSATIILTFICAAPFVLLFSGVVGYGVGSLIH